jgi:hypothetical protein
MKDAALEINYIGSSSSHMFSSAEVNPAVYIPGQSSIANTQQRRLNPQVGLINNTFSAFSANYNVFHVVVNKRYGSGFTILSSYTWSKALGVNVSFGEGSNGPRNPNNYRMDYGLLWQDRTHNFVTSALWDVPWGKSGSAWKRHAIGGWQLSGITAVYSGAPLTVRSGRDNSLTGINGDTADLVGDWRMSGPRGKQDPLMYWFNTAAFAQNATGTFGATGINWLRGPGSWNIDAAAQKNFVFKETRRVEFRSSFYNMMNHANLGNPNTTQNNATFGRITSASTPQVIEFGLRKVF